MFISLIELKMCKDESGRGPSAIIFNFLLDFPVENRAEPEPEVSAYNVEYLIFTNDAASRPFLARQTFSGWPVLYLCVFMRTFFFLVGVSSV